MPARNTLKPKTIMTGIAFGESPRWHQGRLWFSDWVAREIIAVDTEGNSEIMVRVPFPSIPMCIDFLPDGRLIAVSNHESRLFSREPDGSLATYVDLTTLPVLASTKSSWTAAATHTSTAAAST